MSLRIHKGFGLVARIIGWAIVAILAICLIKVFVWEKDYYATKSLDIRKTSDPVVTELESALNPSEEKPTAQEIADHQVEPGDPRYLSIPRLGISNARIFGSDVDNHTLQVPDNIFDTMWFSGSSRPGAHGYIMISGLSAGRSQPGLFANLDSLEKGDKIRIEVGGGAKYTYQVVEINIVDAETAKTVLPEMQHPYNSLETLSLVTGIQATEEGDTSYNSIAMIRAILVEDN